MQSWQIMPSILTSGSLITVLKRTLRSPRGKDVETDGLRGDPRKPESKAGGRVRRKDRASWSGSAGCGLLWPQVPGHYLCERHRIIPLKKYILSIYPLTPFFWRWKAAPGEDNSPAFPGCGATLWTASEKACCSKGAGGEPAATHTEMGPCGHSCRQGRTEGCGPGPSWHLPQRGLRDSLWELLINSINLYSIIIINWLDHQILTRHLRFPGTVLRLRMQQ